MKKGKTYTEIYGKKRAKEIIEKIKKNNTFRFTKHTEESKRNISLSMMGNKNWEHSINKSGRGKKGHYKEQYFMSTWELAYIVYLMEHGVEYKRNWEKFEYFDINGNKRYYVPDFIVNDSYVEIKGYLTKEVELKIKSFKFPLIVIGKEEIKPILNYVEKKYGENFYDILNDEKYTSKKKTKLCKCGKEILFQSKSCVSCSSKNQPRKIKNRPSLDILLDELSKSNYMSLGRKYGVSDRTIRKWIISYGEIPPKIHKKR